MAKLFGHIIVVILLLVSTMGITVSKHYCGGELKSVSLFSEPQHCCEGMTGCCHDETISKKLDQDFSNVSFLIDFSELVVELPQYLEEVYTNQIPLTYSEVADYPEPPDPPIIQEVLASLQTYLL